MLQFSARRQRPGGCAPFGECGVFFAKSLSLNAGVSNEYGVVLPLLQRVLNVTVRRLPGYTLGLGDDANGSEYDHFQFR